LKVVFFFCIIFFFFRVSLVSSELLILPPQEMLAQAEIIVAGEVQELRLNQDPPVFVLQVDKTYRGSTASPRLVLPLPEMPGPEAREQTAGIAPPKGARLLLLLVLDDAGRLLPVADLNWAVFLTEGAATSIFFGAGAGEWREEDYLAAFNGFLSEAGARPAEVEDGEPKPPATAGERSPLNSLRALPLLLAGLFLLAAVLSRKIRKLPDGGSGKRPNLPR
jgi:hypothetical protein